MLDFKGYIKEMAAHTSKTIPTEVFNVLQTLKNDGESVNISIKRVGAGQYTFVVNKENE